MGINNYFRIIFIFSNFCYLFLLFVQFSIPGNDEIQLYYVFLALAALAGIVYFPYVFRISINNPMLLLFLAILIYNLLINGIEYGFRIDNIRLVILLVSLYVGIASYKALRTFGMQRCLNIIGVGVLFFVILRALVYYPQLVSLISSGRVSLQGTSYPFFAAGGHNMEVTYILILSAIVASRKLYSLLLIVGVVYSFFYESRVGIILSILVLLYRNNWIGLSRQSFFGVFVILIILSIGFFAGIGVFERFIQIEEELEYGEQGIGRIGFYFGAFDMLSEGVTSVGVSNAVYVMSDITGISYRENNVHNIYLQHFLDSGYIALFLFLGLAFNLLKESIKKQNSFLPAAAVFLFVISGVIQFTGYDSIAWYFIGFFLPYLFEQNLERKSNPPGN